MLLHTAWNYDDSIFIDIANYSLVMAYCILNCTIWDHFQWKRSILRIWPPVYYSWKLTFDILALYPGNQALYEIAIIVFLLLLMVQEIIWYTFWHTWIKGSNSQSRGQILTWEGSGCTSYIPEIGTSWGILMCKEDLKNSSRSHVKSGLLPG